MILKCEICGIDVEVTEEAAEAIFERKRLQPKSKLVCPECFARSLTPLHSECEQEQETGEWWGI